MARTIISWFKWIEKNTGYVKVTNRKSIVNNINKSLIEKPVLERLKERKDPNLEFKSSFRYDVKLTVYLMHRIISRCPLM